MSVITRVPEPRIWDVICKEFASLRPPFRDDDLDSVQTDLQDYDPSKVTPVFYGKMMSKMDVDSDPTEAFDSSQSHPAAVGYSAVTRPALSPPPPPQTPPPPKTCSPQEYLEHHIFPVLLPAMEEMLKQAKEERCFERKRTKFNALDFLTEFLYKHNCRHTDRDDVVLWDIPFVKEWLKDHPRPPLPKSLLWSEEEATLIIQSHWRGFKIRSQPEVQELRQWQMEWRRENENIHHKVSDFWNKQMPEDNVKPASMDQVKDTVNTSSVV